MVRYHAAETAEQYRAGLRFENPSILLFFLANTSPNVSTRCIMCARITYVRVYVCFTVNIIWREIELRS